MINSKLIAFIAGTSVGALSAITGIVITAKMFETNAEEEAKAVNEEQTFFVNSARNYLKLHELNDEKIKEYTDVIEDVCNYFEADYRKFLVGLYDYIVRDEYEMLIVYLVSVQNILKQYNSVRYMDTNQTINSIINDESDNKTDNKTADDESVAEQ